VDIPTKWIIIWLPNHGYQFPTSKSTWKPNFAQIGGFLYLTAILYLGYHGNGRHFEFINTPKAATHYGGYSYKVSWSLMKGIQNVFKSPLFYFHGNCGKVCQTDSNFFGLSRSTTCGYCSYQVSSISVRRVIRYDQFCVFQFFCILAISISTAAILKIPKVVCSSTHSA
jgi:hypothetical protein